MIITIYEINKAAIVHEFPPKYNTQYTIFLFFIFFYFYFFCVSYSIVICHICTTHVFQPYVINHRRIFFQKFTFQCLNTYLIDTLQCFNTYDIDDKLYKCINKITNIFASYDIFNNLSKFKTKLFAFLNVFSISCHGYPICPFLKQLIFQCVHIYEVYSYMFECLGDYHSNKRSE